MFHQSDEKLITKALDGSESAWVKLVKRYENDVYRFAYRMLGNKDDAFDLTQETFMAVCRNLAKFRGDSQFKTWLLTIARYRCFEFYKKREQQKQHVELDRDEQDTLFACETTEPEFNMANTYQVNRLNQQLQKIPYEQRVVVEMKLFQQQTFLEISNQLSVSENTVKTRFYVALDKLKQLFEGAENAA